MDYRADEAGGTVEHGIFEPGFRSMKEWLFFIELDNYDSPERRVDKQKYWRSLIDNIYDWLKDDSWV